MDPLPQTLSRRPPSGTGNASLAGICSVPGTVPSPRQAQFISLPYSLRVNHSHFTPRKLRLIEFK